MGRTVVEVNRFREFDIFGQDTKVLVLKFKSDALKARYNQLIEAGATSDFPDYKPHITLCEWDKPTVPNVPVFTGLLTFADEEVKKNAEFNGQTCALYINRPLFSSSAHNLNNWAKQVLKCELQEGPHVTLVWSPTPVDNLPISDVSRVMVAYGGARE